MFTFICGFLLTVVAVSGLYALRQVINRASKVRIRAALLQPIEVRQELRPWAKGLAGLAAVVTVYIIYTGIVAEYKTRNPTDTLMPSVSQFAEALADLREPNSRGEIVFDLDVEATAKRLFRGLAWSTLLGVILGMLMGCVPIIGAFLRPLSVLSNKLVPMAMTAVFLIVVGLDERLYTVIIVFGTVPGMAISVAESVGDVPIEQVVQGGSLGAARNELVWSVVFPQTLPHIIKAVQATIGPALNYLIASEMLFADTGFGKQIRYLSRLMDMSTVYIYLLILLIAGFLLSGLMRAMLAILCPWYKG